MSEDDVLYLNVILIYVSGRDGALTGVIGCLRMVFIFFGGVFLGSEM